MPTTVEDVMTRPPVTVTPHTPVPEAVRLLREHGVRRLPVLEDGRLAGIVTGRDLKEALPSDATTLSIWGLSSQLARLEARGRRSRSVVTVAEDAPLRDAAHTMLRRKVGGPPVVNARNELVGVVTSTDVLRDDVGQVAPAAP